MEEKYTNIAVLFHWLTAVLVIGLLALGWYMTDLEGSEKGYFYRLHKSFGLTVYFIVLLRLVWRLKNPPPPLPNNFNSFHVKMSRFVHRMAYLSLLVMPLMGYLSSSFSGYKTSWFGLNLYHWGWKHEALNSFFSQAHQIFGYVLFIIITIHLSAVIFHLITKKINLLPRIWFHKKTNVNEKRNDYEK